MIASSAAKSCDDEIPYKGSSQFFSNPSMYVQYPEDVVNYRHYIIKEVLPDMAVPGSKLDAIVGEADFPEYCWVILLGINYSQALEKLMQEMQTMSAWHPMDREAMLPGQFCAAFVDGAWCRVRIICLDKHADNAVVSLLDWGGNRTISCGTLRWLPLKFAKLPQQALLARLVDFSEDLQLTSGQQFSFKLDSFQSDELVLKPISKLRAELPSSSPFIPAIRQVAEDRRDDCGKNETLTSVCCKMYRADLGLHVFCKENCWMLSLKEVTERYISHLHYHVVRAIAEAFMPDFRLQFVNVTEFNRGYDFDMRRKCTFGKKRDQMVRVQDMPELLRALNVHDLNLPDCN